MSYESRISNLESRKIKSFTDLNAWKEGHTLVIQIYEATKQFPKEEMFALISQLRRAGVSLTSDIAEGFSRNTLKEKIQFYTTALGCLTEIQNQLLVARDVGYLSSADFQFLANQTVEVSKVLGGLIKKTKEMSRNSKFEIRDSSEKTV